MSSTSVSSIFEEVRLQLITNHKTAKSRMDVAYPALSRMPESVSSEDVTSNSTVSLD
jgi:hypothetical protein